MPPHVQTGRIVRFGTFELDLQEARLTKSGLRIRLQGQPYLVLTLLIQRAGEIVSREEIRQKLWSNQTFVEFDDALNTAVGKLRAAIGDTAENPRYVETVPRRGYRFIAPVTWTQPFESPRQAEVPTAPADPQPLSSAPPVQNSPPPVATVPAQNHLPSSRLKTRHALILATSLLVLVAVVVGGFLWSRKHSKYGGIGNGTVVLADFINTTGEAVFEDALRQALDIGLDQSPLIQILPDRKTSVILAQMGHSADQRMVGKTAIEVCQRAGGKVTVQGSIASLGTAYLIGLAAIRCDNGEPIANEQAEARRKEDVVDALGQATARLRSRLGESLPSIQKYNAPLEQATTSSLEALNAYSLALLTWDKKGNRDSLPILKKAVELDPNFAQAYGALATVYHNLGQDNLARENATKAYELRTHVTQAEKSSLEARYHAYVTGDLDKVGEVRTLEAQNYPESSGVSAHLGNIDQALGRYDQAVLDYRRALEIDPSRAGSHSDLVSALLSLNRVDEAAAVLADASRRGLHTDLLTEANYWVAFLRGDHQELASLVQQSSGRPESQAMMLAEQANTEAYHGRFRKADELSAKAGSLMEQQGDTDAAARYLAQAALRDAEAGDAAKAEPMIAKAQKLSQGQTVITLIALAEARLGNLARAEALSKQLDTLQPTGTYVQKYWLPVIRAEMDLNRGKPSKALDDLSLLNPPLEFAGPTALPLPTLYPSFVRGQAYLAAGDGGQAQIEFQKLRDHKNALVNYPLGPMAIAEHARAFAHKGEAQKARQSYTEFLALWKDADPTIKPLKDAKAELAALR